MPYSIVGPFVEAAVDRSAEHLALWSDLDGESRLVAVVAPARRGRFTVQVLMPDDRPTVSTIIGKAIGEIEFYLYELHERDPWAYAVYHCGTTANAFSDVHWTYFPYGADARGDALSEPPKRSNACPECGDRSRKLRIAWGYPSRELAARADRGEVALGGCLIPPDPPTHACARCGAPLTRRNGRYVRWTEPDPSIC